MLPDPPHLINDTVVVYAVSVQPKRDPGSHRHINILYDGLAYQLGPLFFHLGSVSRR